MVLARSPEHARIWGSGSEISSNVVVSVIRPGAASVRIGQTVVSTDGTWELELEPQEACMSATLTITISRDQQKINEEMVTLNNVAFGDVFFCSGQSNMLLTVGINEMHSDVVKRYTRARPGILRGYTVVHQLANEPQDAFEQHGTWKVADDHFAPQFSAVCSFAAMHVSMELGPDIPIGMVISAVGSTLIEEWMSMDSIRKCRKCDAPKGPPTPHTCACRFNAMVHPVFRMRVKLAIWYQGETGISAKTACLLSEKIRDWRHKFGISDLPYFYVELAATNHRMFPLQRAAMRAATHADSGVSYATAIDLGDKGGGLHPARKLEIGRRLSLRILEQVYGLTQGMGPSQGPEPIPSRATVKATDEGLQILLPFDFAAGLHLAGTADCDELTFADQECCGDGSVVFEVGGAGGYSKWHTATARVLQDGNGDTVEILVPTLGGTKRRPAIVEVRYGVSGYPHCALYNGKGGPDDHTGVAAAPFRISLSEPGSCRVECSEGFIGKHCCIAREMCLKNMGCFNTKF